MHSELGKKWAVKKAWLSWKDATHAYAYQLEATTRWLRTPGPKPLHQLIKILKKKEYE